MWQYATARDLLTRHRATVARFLDAHYVEFFEQYMPLGRSTLLLPTYYSYTPLGRSLFYFLP